MTCKTLAGRQRADVLAPRIAAATPDKHAFDLITRRLWQTQRERVFTRGNLARAVVPRRFGFGDDLAGGFERSGTPQPRRR
jgi:hypothetical protein